MKYLVIKDLVTSSKSILLVVFMFIIFSLAPPNLGDVYLIVGIYLFAMKNAYVEDRNNTFVLLKTMPFSSKTIVLSKYVSLLLIAVFYLGVGVLTLYFTTPAKLVDFIFGILLMLVMMGIFLLLFFYKGYQKSYQISVVLFLLIFLILIMPRFIAGTGELNLKFSGGTLALIGMGAGITYLITAYSAIKLFEKRECE